MGEVLRRALETRGRAAHWLATERLSDWDLFFAVAGEVHGAIEGLWHGVDANHPLHRHPSAPSAAESLRATHRALDGMIATLVRSVGRDAAIVAFAMGGMGPNHSDVQSMVLLPELLYRHAFDSPLLRVPAPWTAARDHLPIVGEDEPWNVASCVPLTVDHGRLSRALRSFVQQRPRLRAGVRALQAALLEWRAAAEPIPTRSLDWQPASRYATHWPRMPAFALPSFYDGRVRINLKGRERDGIVEASRYENVCRNIETLLRECRNPLTGEPAVESIERASAGDPLRLGSSESDLLVVWRGVATALEHPRLGLIGPVPLRRTGGHTGRYGIAYVRAPGIRVGDHGVRSAFDVAPTIIELLGCESDAAVSGTSLLTGSGMLNRASW